MTVRTIDPLQAVPLPRAWNRGTNWLTEPKPERVPEPAQLYSLIVLTFVLHEPGENTASCLCCQKPWPCEQVRHAYRLREGF